MTKLRKAAVSCPPSNSEGAWQDIQAKNNEILAHLKAIEPHSPHGSKEFYSIHEVAQYVKRSPYTVRKWILDGKIKAIRIAGTGTHGRLLVPHSEFLRLFE